MKNSLNLANKISIGTANFNQNYGFRNNRKLDLKDINNIFNFCKKNNIQKIDTSLNYENDKILKLHNLNNYEITTKIPNIIGNDKEVFKELKKRIYESLRTLKINSFYCILLHDPIRSMKQNKKLYIDLLNFFKNKQLTLKIGYSIYDMKEFNYLCKILKPDVVQAPLNIFDNDFNKLQSINKLNKNKIEFQSRSIFLQGLLLKNKIPPEFKKLEYAFKKWKITRNKKKISKLRDCINHSFSRDHVNSCIVGVENFNQLKKIFDFSLKIEKKLINDDIINISNTDKIYIKPNKWKYVI